MLPEVEAKLTADVDQFIRAWERAAAAAMRAAAQIRAAMAAASGDIDVSGISRFREEIQKSATAARSSARDIAKIGESARGMDRVGDAARRAAAGLHEFGNGARSAGEGVNRLGEHARRAGGAFGGGGGSGGGGGGLIGALGQASMRTKAFLVAAAVGLTVLPGVAAAALAAGAALQGLGVVAGVIIGGWRGIEQAGERLKATLGGLQKQLESVFRAELSREFQQLGQAISQMDGPLKAIARSTAGVIKEFTGWIRSSEGMREIETMLGGVDRMVKALAPGAKALAQAFTGFGAAAAPAMDDIGKALSSVFEQLNKVIQKGRETGQLQKAFENGAKAIEAFGAILAGVVDVLIEMAASGGEPAADAMKKFGQALSDAAPVLGVIFGHLARLANVIMTVVGAFASLAKACQPVTDAVQKAGDAFDKAFKNPDGLKKFAGAAVMAFAQIQKAAKEGMDKANQAIKDGWNKANQTIKDAVTKVNQAIKDGFNKTNQAVKDAHNKIVQAVKDGWNKANQTIKDAVDKAIEAVQEWARQTVQDIKDGFDEWVQSAKDGMQKFADNVKAGVDRVVEFIRSLPQKAKDALSNFVRDMKQIGKDAIDGMAEGIKSAVGNLVGAATAAAKAAMSAIKGTLGIRSPSVVMREEVGMMISAGIAEGILANASRVTDAMNRTALGALGAGKGGVAAGAGVSRSGGQVLTIQVLGGADSAAGVFIARLAQQGKLKITANAVVGRR